MDKKSKVNSKSNKKNSTDSSPKLHIAWNWHLKTDSNDNKYFVNTQPINSMKLEYTRTNNLDNNFSQKSRFNWQLNEFS